MKKLVSFNFIFLSTFTFFINAQTIPNNSFENWSTVGSYEEPDNWITYNSFTPSTPTTVKTTPSYEGNYAVKLQVVNDPLLGANTGYAQTGFSMTSKPTTLGWYTKCNIALTGDSVSLHAILYSGGSIVGDAMWAQGTNITSYTQVILPINYYNTSTPDSAAIFMWAGDDLNFMVGTNLIVDKLEFDPSVSGITELSNLAEINLFPNPVKDQMNFTFSSPVSCKLNLKVYNTLGELLFTDVKNIAQGDNDINWNSSELEAGIYYLMLENDDEKIQTKFVKE